MRYLSEREDAEGSAVGEEVGVDEVLEAQLGLEEAVALRLGAVATVCAAISSQTFGWPAQRYNAHSQSKATGGLTKGVSPSWAAA
jgi:hypothetical protein